MHLPSRSVKSIQPLPSIYTTFSANNENNSKHLGKSRIRDVEDGIEVVPIERSNTLSAPILSPDQVEKELFITPKEDSSPSEKPLPSIPNSYWARLSLRQRVLALLGIQLAMVLTVGLSLLGVRNHASPSDLNARTETTGNNSSVTSVTHATSPIARGPFAVPVQLPQQQNSACLARTNESVAWQCASDTTFQFNILPSPMNSNVTRITLGSMPGTNGTLYHGHQAPDVSPVELILIAAAASLDSDESMYHFRSTYNRIVLLKESDLSSASRPNPQPIMRHPTFQNGESIWRCMFNETMIEGYVYPNEKTIASSSFNSTTRTVKDLPKIPYMLKLVEQRMPNGKGPYCEKMKVQDGKLSKIMGEKVMLGLTEPEAEAQAAAKAELIVSAKLRARQQTAESNYCRCQWMVQ